MKLLNINLNERRRIIQRINEERHERFLGVPTKRNNRNKDKSQASVSIP